MTKVEVLATGSEFLKQGVRGTEPVIEEIILNASKEIQILAYVFTSKAIHILNRTEQAARRGVKITIIVNELSAQQEAIKAKLKSMQEIFPHVHVFDFTDDTKKQLHAKIIVADREKAVIGSANFSWGGMYSNYEIGLFVQGETAWKIAQLVDSLKTELAWRTK